MEGDARTRRVAAWGVLWAAFVLYVVEHAGALGAPVRGTVEAPSGLLAAPTGGVAPWLVAAGALVAGALVGRLGVARGVPFGAAFGIGCVASLTAAAHGLELMGWIVGGPTFRPAYWAAGVWSIVAVLAAAARAVQRDRGERPADTRGAHSGELTRDPLRVFLIASAVLAAVLYLQVLGRSAHQGPSQWDAKAYHLPVPLQWVHVGSLTEPLARQVVYGELGLEKFANPGVGHLLIALPLMLGWDRVACFIQLPFVALAAWAVASLARGGGASRSSARLAALAFVSAPIVAHQAGAAMLDLATAALCLAALALLQSAADRPRPSAWSLAFGGISLGLALGTKTSALAQLPLVLFVLASSAWVRSGDTPALARGLGSLIGGASLGAGFWYVRNTLLFGNPIYPLGLEVAGLVVLPGTNAEMMSGYWGGQSGGVRHASDWLLFPFRDPRYFDEAGFGALLACFGTLGLLAGLGRLVSELRRGLDGHPFSPRARLAVLAVLGLAVFWCVAARTPRLNIPLLGLVAALAAAALDGLGPGRGRRMAGALALAMSAVTLKVALSGAPWRIGPPVARGEQLAREVVPGEIDALPADTIFNDTKPEDAAQTANYFLFGADHRHLVYDHRDLAWEDPRLFVQTLRGLGAGYVFLKRAEVDEAPGRYATPALVPVAWAAGVDYEGRPYRSTLYRVAKLDPGRQGGRK